MVVDIWQNKDKFHNSPHLSGLIFMSFLFLPFPKNVTLHKVFPHPPPVYRSVCLPDPVCLCNFWSQVASRSHCNFNKISAPGNPGSWDQGWNPGPNFKNQLTSWGKGSFFLIILQGFFDTSQVVVWGFLPSNHQTYSILYKKLWP